MSDPHVSWQALFDDNEAPSSSSALLMTPRLTERRPPADKQMAARQDQRNGVQWQICGAGGGGGSADRDGSGGLCVDKQSEVDC